MIKRFRDALLWAQALDRYGRQDFDQALAKLDAIRGQRSTATECLSLRGSALIALGRPEEAKVLLSSALSQGSPSKHNYGPYVRAYCNYYLSIIDGDRGAATQHLEAALRLNAPKIIRRWLPLS